MKIRPLLYILFMVLLTIPKMSLSGQPVKDTAKLTAGDSLTLSQVLQDVLKSHPSIKQAEEALNVADAKIGLARAGYYPKIDITASYSHLAPDPALSFPGLGSLLLFPKDNYDASLNINQTIYDFGKTSKDIGLENENKTIVNDNIDILKQNLSLKTINTYYTLVYYQDAIRIKDEELNTLKEHLVYVEKKEATGSATQYELLSTKVRISNTESQKLDLESYQKVQWSILNMLMGSPAQDQPKLKQELKIELPALNPDSLLPYAFSHRTELALAKEKETQAQLNLSIVKTQNAPVLSAFAEGGFKNGYELELAKLYGNYVVGLGLRIPIFDSNRHKYAMEQAQSNITSVGYETDLSQRNITNEVIEANANYENAKMKINQFELQLTQANEAYSLAQTSYTSGAITNLDLLDSETAVSESKLLLLKSRIDFIVSSYKLRIALGDKL